MRTQCGAATFHFAELEARVGESGERRLRGARVTTRRQRCARQRLPAGSARFCLPCARRSRGCGNEIAASRARNPVGSALRPGATHDVLGRLRRMYVIATRLGIGRGSGAARRGR
jgi:hypothetical protein